MRLGPRGGVRIEACDGREMAERGTVLAGPSAELCENAFVARTA